MEPLSAWIIGETGWLNQGVKSVGVAHQYCGAVGKQANRQVSVEVVVSNGEIASESEPRARPRRVPRGNTAGGSTHGNGIGSVGGPGIPRGIWDWRTSSIGGTIPVCAACSVVFCWPPLRLRSGPRPGIFISPTPSARRKALVIGNDAYVTAPPLRNAVNDARDLGARLRQLDFEVTVVTDAGEEGMDRAVRESAGSIEPGDVAFFHFSGHGVPIEGDSPRAAARSNVSKRGRGAEMGVYKRGKVYWYKFVYSGRQVRESTRQGNKRTAEQMEAAHKTRLAKAEVGIVQKEPAPTLADFAPRFLGTIRVQCASKPATIRFYELKLSRLLESPVFTSKRLDEIDERVIAS